MAYLAEEFAIDFIGHEPVALIEAEANDDHVPLRHDEHVPVQGDVSLCSVS